MARIPYGKKKVDYHIVLFSINVALVVIGYGLAYPTGFTSLLPMMYCFLIISRLVAKNIAEVHP